MVACRPEGQGRDDRVPPPPPSYRIAGKVLKPEANDHSGILVYCAGTSYLAYTNAEGRYTITNVPAGKYDVLCQHADYQPASVGEVALVGGSADPATPLILADVTLEPKMTPAEQAERILCSVMGQVLLEGKSVAEGVVVRAVDTDFRTVTDSDGHYQLLRLDPNQYTLVFEKSGYRSKRLAVRLVSGDLVFPQPIVLEQIEPEEPRRILSGSVALLDMEGQALGDYTGVLVYIEGTTRVALPSPSGFFRFEDLAPDRYFVTAMGPGFFNRDRAEADLTQAAEVTVALTLQSFEERTSAPSTLVGRVLKDDPEDTLVGTIVGLVEIGATAMTDPTGNYVFGGVPPGTYNLVALAEGYIPGALEEVVIPEAETVEAADLTLEKRRDYPRVLFTSPADGDRNIVVREIVPLTVRFSKKMRPESLRAAFLIQPDVAYRLYAGREHSLSDFDQLYVELFGFGPENALRFNTAYTVTLGIDASDFEDLHLEEPYAFRFRTGGPSVIATQPPKGATDVYLDPVSHRVGIFFNAPLDPKTVTAEKVHIRPRLRTTHQVRVTGSRLSGWSEISIAASWEWGVRYTVTLSSGIRTRDGSAISNLPYTFSFTTSEGRAIDYVPGPRKPGP